jgi:type I restriction enzyme S subunit
MNSLHFEKDVFTRPRSAAYSTPRRRAGGPGELQWRLQLRSAWRLSDTDDVTSIGLTEGEFAKTRLVEGDLLIVEGNGSIEQIGRVAMWSGEIADCCHQNHLIRWRAGARVLPKFVLCFLLRPEGRRQIEAVASSTTGLHTLSVSKVGELQLRVPSVDLQAEIVRRGTLFAFADRLEAASPKPRPPSIA